jgi:hypothetical protein
MGRFWNRRHEKCRRTSELTGRREFIQASPDQ